ncbi:hypothetical protein BDW74DRAFT_144743 [Aspergillus multicolor]|uniref:uncharacterized protein n=1 Tax=Aspergillus multicolor TaxID=41759 RepID=UPI003CCD3C88
MSAILQPIHFNIMAGMNGMKNLHLLNKASTSILRIVNKYLPCHPRPNRLDELPQELYDEITAHAYTAPTGVGSRGAWPSWLIASITSLSGTFPSLDTAATTLRIYILMERRFVRSKTYQGSLHDSRIRSGLPSPSSKRGRMTTLSPMRSPPQYAGPSISNRRLS